ncbi:MAG: ADP-ribosylglycohydrolase family protein [Cyanobacteria bacterium SID2]|nr:ADP-ribosylglycohydrolase family protein [Cyanobacteria bacterium SID2]MBP0004814.1 ADP-ribosylglycohydrolase family protein [Cyanobacteria bacterium SBC]
MSDRSAVLSGLMGVCVGDALGVPVEFTTRAERGDDPVTDMRGYGTYNQPPGTWSDDSSLTLCLAEALCEDFSLDTISQKFCQWFTAEIWTPHGEVFDIGGSTTRALGKLMRGVSPTESGETGERSNGNGSLMRILPMVYYAESVNTPVFLDRVHQVSAITHAHPRSQMACGIYVSIAAGLLDRVDPKTSYEMGLNLVESYYSKPPFVEERHHFDRIWNDITTLSIDEIISTGYVVHSLEAALWCFLSTDNYAEAVLQAVNLGNDTDTIAAITGGLAGLYYGFNAIPKAWVNSIARKDDIIDLAKRLEASMDFDFLK